MSTKFEKYFKKTLLNEASPTPQPQVDPTSDKAAFDASFENPANLDQINAEVASAQMDPQHRAEIIKKANKYADNIVNVILPNLRQLQKEIADGIFKEIAPQIKNISSINGDIAKLAEELRGKTLDAIIKNDNEGK